VKESWLASPDFPALVAYVHRASYLLSQGRPATGIALFYPAANLWRGDADPDARVWMIAAGLLEAQRDFDFVDDVALAATCALKKGAFENKGGQKYRAVVIPPGSILSAATRKRLDSFVRTGGLVIEFPGPLPDVSSFIERLQGSLPPDIEFDAPCPDIKALHRRLADVDLYFLFNESDAPQMRRVRLAGIGKLATWDAWTGLIERDGGLRSDWGVVEFSLEMRPWESKFVLIGRELD
jgi:hypothetical protein